MANDEVRRTFRGDPYGLLSEAQPLALNAFDGSVPATSYPLGDSKMPVTSASAGWPTAAGYDILTIRFSTTRAKQWAYRDQSGSVREYFRNWDSTIPAWGGWIESTDYNNLQNIPAVVVPDIPVGTVVDYVSLTAPSGSSKWRECRGQTLSRTSFPELNALMSGLGYPFGAGDGTTTFNLPDLRGRVMVGNGQGAGLTFRTTGDVGGAETHQLTTAQMPSHNHGTNTQSDGGHSHTTYGNQVATTTATGNFNRIANLAGAASNNTGVTDTGGGHTHPINLAGGDGAHNNMPPFFVAMKLMRVTP